ncbi:MAG: type II toxin-antitoxin system HicB family antitoxin [Gaiellaceae bacterium MAG52_C11]|nr:type II toxin-antitoxin system HicB family antitoxin [Candidatus Gaiellasilicea maunaloa]
MGSRAAPAELIAADDREKAPSGRLLLRMPRTLHAELARAAEREGTSLNGFITGSLASTIGWRGEDGDSPALSSAPAGRRQTRLLLAVLLANAVVVGVAAVAAVGILLLAWLG